MRLSWVASYTSHVITFVIEKALQFPACYTASSCIASEESKYWSTTLKLQLMKSNCKACIQRCVARMWGESAHIKHRPAQLSWIVTHHDQTIGHTLQNVFLAILIQYTYDCIFLERGLVTRKCNVYSVMKSNGDESSQRHKGQKAVVVSNTTVQPSL